MFRFTPWYPEGCAVATRFYFNDDEFIDKRKKQKLRINTTSQYRRIEVADFLAMHGIDIEDCGIRELHVKLGENGLLISGGRSSRARGRSSHHAPQPQPAYGNVYQFGSRRASTPFREPEPRHAFRDLSARELFQESQATPASSVKFQPEVRADSVILVDHREPPELLRALRSIGGVTVSSAQLPYGDIVITTLSDPGREFVLERKTITNAYVDLTGDERKLHRQAEALYEYQNKAAQEGREVRVGWLLEAENEGQRVAQNMLPQLKQYDGLLNYWIGILGQYVVETRSLTHTASLVARLCQGFNAQELYYPITLDRARVDRTKGSRLTLQSRPLTSQAPGMNGVTRPQDGLSQMLTVMGVRSNVAKLLADTGKSLAEVTQMSREELLAVKGVGPKLCDQIYQIFNLKG